VITYKLQTPSSGDTVRTSAGGERLPGCVAQPPDHITEYRGYDHRACHHPTPLPPGTRRCAGDPGCETRLPLGAAGLCGYHRDLAYGLPPEQRWALLMGTPHRADGLILIIGHGDGYHSLLAGLGRAEVSVGQWVLAGEPVGVMPDAAEPGSDGVFYFELRRDGRPVDPQPWLAKRDDTTERGDKLGD